MYSLTLWSKPVPVNTDTVVFCSALISAMNIRSPLFPSLNAVKISILHHQQRLSSDGAGSKLILTERKNKVTRLTMNNPHKLNGWTVPMLNTLFSSLRTLAEDTETRVVVLTGSGEGRFNVRDFPGILFWL